MAKIEKASIKALKKSKGKKRKHEANDDDAVANKSIILSKEPENFPPKNQISKKLKRKATDDAPEKESKSVNKSKKQKEESIDGDEDETIEEPTAEELRECEKPENIKAVVTVRQKKKQNHQQRLEAQKDKSTNKEVTRIEEYLQKWKNNRDEWKFEKLRQISIQQSVFDDKKVSGDLWPIALEYLSGSKGAAKEKITKAAEAVIDKLDKEAEKATDGDSTLITSSEEYRRARELLQSFD